MKKAKIIAIVNHKGSVGKTAFEFTDVVSAQPEANGSKNFQVLADEIMERL